MNTYTYTYYGFIPGYNDFDQDWFDVKANTIAEADQKAKEHAKLASKGPALVAINGHSLDSIEAMILVASEGEIE